jgi:hypothetical protein
MTDQPEPDRLSIVDQAFAAGRPIYFVVTDEAGRRRLIPARTATSRRDVPWRTILAGSGWLAVDFQPEPDAIIIEGQDWRPGVVAYGEDEPTL